MKKVSTKHTGSFHYLLGLQFLAPGLNMASSALKGRVVADVGFVDVLEDGLVGVPGLLLVLVLSYFR